MSNYRVDIAPSLAARRVARVALSIALTFLLACSSSDDGGGLRGLVIQDRRPAPDFRLTDQFGAPVTLSERNHGRVVVLTFLYTSCPDVCPITAHHLKGAHDLLGEDVKGVSTIIVSVDPARDTVERAREYVDAWGMTDEWTFLVGREDELSAVWRDYYVSPALNDSDEPSDIPDAWRVPPPPSGVDALRRDVGARYTVAHQAPVYLIDTRGRLRTLHSLPIDPADIASDIRILLRER